MTDQEKHWLRSLATRKRQERFDRFRDEYGERGVAILNLLVHHDPAGLVKSGAPPVQYISEAGFVYRGLLEARSLEEARGIIRQVLSESFLRDVEPSERLTSAVWSSWNRSYEG